MRVWPLGESVLILSDLGDRRPYELARAVELAGIQGLEEVAPAPESVGLYFRNKPPDPFELARLASELPVAKFAATRHAIPVCYELGLDPDFVARSTELVPAAVAEAHSSATYTCMAVGFQPGFPYLAGLVEKLGGLNRRPSPRTKVPAGSVGITGSMCGIYPVESPGGWHIVGLTPLCLVDLGDAYFPIKAGDEILFHVIGEDEFSRLRGERL
jgi:inhibitor of KinA